MEVNWKLELMIHLHLSPLYDVTCLGPEMSAVCGLQSVFKSIHSLVPALHILAGTGGFLV